MHNKSKNLGKILKENLKNYPRIVGMEPLSIPRTPICGSLEKNFGNVSADDCTQVWHTNKPISNDLRKNGNTERQNCKVAPRMTTEHISSAILLCII